MWLYFIYCLPPFLRRMRLEDKHFGYTYVTVTFFFFFSVMGYPANAFEKKQQEDRHTMTWKDFAVLYSAFCFSRSTPVGSAFYHDIANTSLWKDTRAAHTWIIMGHMMTCCDLVSWWQQLKRAKTEYYSFQAYLLKIIKDKCLISKTWELWSRDIRCLPWGLSFINYLTYFGPGSI